MPTSANTADAVKMLAAWMTEQDARTRALIREQAIQTRLLEDLLHLVRDLHGHVIGKATPVVGVAP